MGCNTSQEQPPPQTGPAVTSDESNGGEQQNSTENGLAVPSCAILTTDSSAKTNNISCTDIKNQTKGGLDYSKDDCEKNNQGSTAANELEEEDFGEDEEKAALKIQSVFRGHKVRATMKNAEPTTGTQSNAASGLSTKQEPEQSKTEMEAEFDPNDEELCNAATKIQATFRGHLQRKLATGDKNDVDLDEITKKVAEELDIDLSDPELHKAATKIQASFRGHKTRKDIPTN